VAEREQAEGQEQQRQEDDVPRRQGEDDDGDCKPDRK
jgi:hypothetical protein